MAELTTAEISALLNPQTVEVVVAQEFIALIAARPQPEILLAIRIVDTHDGAEQIFAAEGVGRKRPAILDAASRRMDELTTTH